MNVIISKITWDVNCVPKNPVLKFVYYVQITGAHPELYFITPDRLYYLFIQKYSILY